MRREADLETYAGNLQREGGAPASVLPPAEAAQNGNGAAHDAEDDGERATSGSGAKRLNFWSR